MKTANPKNKKSTAFIIPHFSSKADFQNIKSPVTNTLYDKNTIFEEIITNGEHRINGKK